MLTIKKYCRLGNGVCSLDGKTFFKAEFRDTKEFLAGLYRAMGLDYPKFFKMDLLAKSGFLAAELVLQGAVTGNGQRTGLFLANCSSSLDTDRHYQDTIGEAYFPSPSVFVYTLPNIVSGEICIRHKIYGENTFFVSREFPAKRMYRYVEKAFDGPELDGALVGWLECDRDRCDVLVLWVEREGTGMDFTEDRINKLYKEPSYGRIDCKIKE